MLRTQDIDRVGGCGPVNGTVRRREGQFLLSQSLLDQLEQFLPAGLQGHSLVSEASESLDSLAALQFGQEPVRPFRQCRKPKVQNQRNIGSSLMSKSRSCLALPIISCDSPTRCRSGRLRPATLRGPRKQVGVSPSETILSTPSGSMAVKGSLLAKAAARAPISVSPPTTETRCALLSSPIQALRWTRMCVCVFSVRLR